LGGNAAVSSTILALMASRAEEVPISG